MLVFRIGRTKWATSLDGEGSRLHGGRWNHIGIPCVYTSGSRALAILEYTVNTNIADIPRFLSITSIDIPDNILDHRIATLPGDWRDTPAPTSTKDFGTNALRALTHSVLSFPSTTIPEELNFLLNPLHRESSKFKIIEVKDFIYDIRIKIV